MFPRPALSLTNCSCETTPKKVVQRALIKLNNMPVYSVFRSLTFLIYLHYMDYFLLSNYINSHLCPSIIEKQSSENIHIAFAIFFKCSSYIIEYTYTVRNCHTKCLLTRVSSLGICLTTLSMSSSVTVTRIQFSSSDGNGFWPFFVTHGSSCNKII